MEFASIEDKRFEASKLEKLGFQVSLEHQVIACKNGKHYILFSDGWRKIINEMSNPGNDMEDFDYVILCDEGGFCHNVKTQDLSKIVYSQITNNEKYDAILNIYEQTKNEKDEIDFSISENYFDGFMKQYKEEYNEKGEPKWKNRKLSKDLKN